MACNAEDADPEREAVDKQSQLYGHNSIDEVCQDLLRYYCMLLHELAQIVQARCCVMLETALRSIETQVGVPIARTRKPNPKTTPR